jgi:osmotically-inducible protein OsmY
MKRGITGLYVLAVVSLMGMAGCGKPEQPATGPSGGSPTDAKIVKTIEAKIAADKTLKGASIKVQQQNQAIVLEGTVASIAQKDQAEQIVIQAQKEANRPIGVQDNLMVKE